MELLGQLLCFKSIMPGAITTLLKMGKTTGIRKPKKLTEIQIHQCVVKPQVVVGLLWQAIVG